MRILANVLRFLPKKKTSLRSEWVRGTQTDIALSARSINFYADCDSRTANWNFKFRPESLRNSNSRNLFIIHSQCVSEFGFDKKIVSFAFRFYFYIRIRNAHNLMRLRKNFFATRNVRFCVLRGEFSYKIWKFTDVVACNSGLIDLSQAAAKWSRTAVDDGRVNSQTRTATFGFSSLSA